MSKTLALALLFVAAAGCDRGPVAGADERAAVAAKAAAASTAEGPAAAPATAPATAAAPSGTVYGAGVTMPTVTPIDAVIADPKAFAGKPLRVEGRVTDVCPKRGCWIELAGSAPGETLMFKVTDGQMVFPMEAKGQHAVVEGVLAVKELTLEETKQRAEYRAKEYGKPVDPAAITQPELAVRLDGTGAVIRAQP